MNFKNAQQYFKQNFGIEITQSDFLAKTYDVIDKINTSLELASELKRIVVEVLNGIVNSIKYGFTPHNTTKEKLKKTVDVLEKFGKLDSNTEEQKQTITALAFFAKEAIDRNPNIPRENHKRW